jgi:hypothetical protein
MAHLDKVHASDKLLSELKNKYRQPDELGKEELVNAPRQVQSIPDQLHLVAA